MKTKSYIPKMSKKAITMLISCCFIILPVLILCNNVVMACEKCETGFGEENPLSRTPYALQEDMGDFYVSNLNTMPQTNEKAVDEEKRLNFYQT